MEPLYKALKETTSQMGLGKVYEAGMLIPKWKDLVGDQVAKNTQPIMIRGETLVVRTTSPAWSHQLTMLKPQLLAKLKSAGVGISDLTFRAASPLEIKEESAKLPGIKAPPRYNGVPEEIEPALRRALASFIGAIKAKNNDKDSKCPAKYDKINKDSKDKTHKKREVF